MPESKVHKRFTAHVVKAFCEPFSCHFLAASPSGFQRRVYQRDRYGGVARHGLDAMMLTATAAPWSGQSGRRHAEGPGRVKGAGVDGGGVSGP